MSLSRRDFLRRGLSGAAGVGALSGLSGAIRADGPAPKPNFIIFFCDDMGYGDICVPPFTNTDPTRQPSCPNFQQLANEGRRFEDFCVAGSVCTPSRCGLLTGRYPRRVSPEVADKVGGNMPTSEITLADKLRGLGYATAVIGKWHLGVGANYYPHYRGFDYWFGTPVNNDLNLYQATASPLSLVTVDSQTNLDWIIRRFTAESIKFMRESLAQNKPFFLYMPHTMPHTELHTSRQFTSNPNDPPYPDVIEEVDWSMGQILREVKHLGIDNNTLIIFTSDNGPWLKEDRDDNPKGPLPRHHAGRAGIYREGKGTTFEGGQREPCIIWGPGLGVPAGTLETRPANAMDIFPTLVLWAGGTVPTDRTYDGCNIRGMIDGTGARADGGTYRFFYYRCKNNYWNTKAANKVGWAGYRKYDYGSNHWKINTAYVSDTNCEIPMAYPDLLHDFSTLDGRKELDSANMKSQRQDVWDAMYAELLAMRSAFP